MNKLILISLILLGLSAFGFCSALTYTDNFNNYDLGIIDGQYYWASNTGGFPFYIQNWAGQQCIGYGSSMGLQDTQKKYWNNSQEGEVDIWLWILASQPFLASPDQIKLLDENGITCGIISMGVSGGFPNYPLWVFSNGDTYLAETNQATKLSIRWSNATSGLKFQYDVASGTDRYYTSWFDSYSTTCQYDSLGINDLRLIFTKGSTSAENIFISSIITENGIYYANNQANEYQTQVSGVSLNWAEFDATNTQWDFGVAVQGINYFDYDPNLNELKVEVYDENDNLLSTKIQGVSRYDIGLKSGVLSSASWLNFKLYYDFFNATGTATTTRYLIKTSFYDSSSSTWTMEQEWFISINTDLGYMDKETWREQYSLIIDQDYLDTLGWGNKIIDFYMGIVDIFPFSWIFGIYNAWIDSSNDSYSTATPPSVSWTFPATSTYFAGKTFTLFDLSTPNNQYYTYFQTFRTLIGYVLWVSLAFLLFDRVKSFINNLKEED